MCFVFQIFIGSVSEDMKIWNQHTVFSKVYLYIDKYLEGCYKSKPKGSATMATTLNITNSNHYKYFYYKARLGCMYNGSSRAEHLAISSPRMDNELWETIHIFIGFIN